MFIYKHILVIFTLATTPILGLVAFIIYTSTTNVCDGLYICDFRNCTNNTSYLYEKNIKQFKVYNLTKDQCGKNSIFKCIVKNNSIFKNCTYDDYNLEVNVNIGKKFVFGIIILITIIIFLFTSLYLLGKIYESLKDRKCKVMVVDDEKYNDATPKYNELPEYHQIMNNLPPKY